ncbi:hypothetical protein [Sphingomonas sp. DT-207]|uniref:hypothetical protein n=1 Tax=Sphingomonas sp. DT-207 TaxID=3396167 RepID=UPI003F541253
MAGARLAALLALATLAGCAAGGPPPGPAPAAPAERIEMETRSWGKLVSRWSVGADGKGSQTTPEPNIFDARTLATRRFDAGPVGFSELQAELAEAERHAGQQLPCTNRITDQHYGEVRWLRGATPAKLNFDTGCRDTSTQAVVTVLRAADARVTGWAKAAPVAERQPVQE